MVCEKALGDLSSSLAALTRNLEGVVEDPATLWAAKRAQKARQRRDADKPQAAKVQLALRRLDKAQKALDAGLALMVTEWGTVNADGDGKVDRESTQAWFDFIAKNQLSHFNWSVADKVEGAAILKPGASGKGGWKDSELTESGLYVRELIRGWKH